MAYKKRAGSRKKRAYKKKNKKGSRSLKKYVSAIPQRQNIKTLLVSDLPKVGFRSLKRKDTVLSHCLLASETNVTGTNSRQFAATGDKMSYSINMIAPGIIRGNAFNTRTANSIKIVELCLSLLFSIPRKERISGGGQVTELLMGHRDKIRICVVVDKQPNNVLLTDATEVFEQSGEGFESAMMPYAQRNLENYKRFEFLHDEVISLSDHMVAYGAFNTERNTGANAVYNRSIKIDRRIYYDDDFSGGEAIHIKTNNIYMIWGNLNQLALHDDPVTVKSQVDVDGMMRAFYTEASF